MENFYSNDIQKLSNNSDDFTDTGVLSLVSVLGSSISLVGLVFAFITYSLFSDLRNLNGTSLMNLIASLFMNQLLYIICVGGVQDHGLCLSLVFSLHYIRMTAWAWLMVMTYHTYRGFQENLNLLTAIDSSLPVTFWKSSIFAWGYPMIHLAVSVPLQALDTHNFRDVEPLQASNCSELTGLALTVTVLVPTCIFLAVILSLLVKIVLVMKKTVALQASKKARTKMLKRRTVQVALFVKLTTVLSAATLTSILYQLTEQPVLWMLANLLQCSQGIIVALCVTCNCHVLRIYTRSLHKRPKPQLYGGHDSELSVSMSLQLLHAEPTPDIV